MYNWDESFTLQHHPLPYAFLEPAILTPVPLGFRYLAGAFRYARVYSPVLDGTFEEPFASIRTENGWENIRDAKNSPNFHLYTRYHIPGWMPKQDCAPGPRVGPRFIM